ncbi:LIC11966 family surface protein [Microscilla marina]|uniref:Uncharacterized protein n=1 Tax=Microscilla marina ATCC 23134 TaxID=313606 RepID=A2A0A4_MICM2|nr:hypothetical protein [Microscilla marina]EAY23920.1 hypothetical protein M23134_00350 [Microscilla marina ATCC 23134]
MTNKIYWGVAMVWLTLLTQCLPKDTRAIEYNNKIVSIQKKINTGLDSFYKTLEKGDSAAIVPAYDTLVKTINDQLIEARNLKPLGKDSTFKATALGLFDVYHRIIEVDFARMVPLLMQAEVSEEEKNLLVDMEKKLKKDEKAAYQKFKKAQQAFAKKHNFKLE